jgi:hypothetical protein
MLILIKFAISTKSLPPLPPVKRGSGQTGKNFRDKSNTPKTVSRLRDHND